MIEMFLKGGITMWLLIPFIIWGIIIILERTVVLKKKLKSNSSTLPEALDGHKNAELIIERIILEEQIILQKNLPILKLLSILIPLIAIFCK
ncbi:hypothetical protein H8E88_03895 [candidate division KSB1 bacterium]|nr:hypothetical protein [candidate division KSB1 bacterium]MBL7093552.1 hypothetical protein [candidate division KSB1 bacterium]